MNQNNDQNREEQEVDLVPVFVWISRGIGNFFRGIGNFFKALGHAIILFLIFLQKNIILIGIFVLIGLGLGYFLDSTSQTNYTAQLRVEPNFESSSQLISNVKFYNALTGEEDFDRLAKELNISKEEAQKIKSFKIEPSYNDTELLEEYDRLARVSDTMALENFSFQGFKESKREIDYRFYEILVKAENRAVLEKALSKVVDINENPGIKAARLATIETIDFNLTSNNYQLRELDSLIASYQKRIQSTSGTGGNTNLYVGDQQSSDNLVSLFEQKRALLFEMQKLREDKYSSDNIVNTISVYVVQGNIENDRTKLKLVIGFFILGVLVAFIPIAWKFLKSYPEQANK